MAIGQLAKRSFNFFNLKSSFPSNIGGTFPISKDDGTYNQRNGVASEVSN